MSVESAKRSLDHRIDALTAELTKLKAMRAALDDRELVAHLYERSSNGGTKSGRKKPVKTGGKSNKEQVVQCLLDNGNEWKSAPDLMEATGLDRGVVNNILYVANAKDFEHKPNPKLKRGKLWRLKAHLLSA